MTLLLTEVSFGGVAMISDTEVRRVNPGTNAIIAGIAPTVHRKLFRLPRLGPLQLPGAVSYWGTFGLIIPDPAEFERWIESIVSHTRAQSLMEFATELASVVNDRCGNRVLKQPVGFHIAGYHSWRDPFPRPTFLHVHNGHLHTKLESQGYSAAARTGSRNQKDPVSWEDGLLRQMIAHHTGQCRIFPTLEAKERDVFRIHHDFPDLRKTDAENELILNDGYLTANGDYFRVTIRREHEALQIKRKQIDPPPRPIAADYLEQRLAWMTGTARGIEKDMARDGAPSTFGGSYQELGFDCSGTVIARGLGMV